MKNCWKIIKNKLKLRHTQTSHGFTLIEFLIVIGILSLSVGSIILLLTTVLRGANQTNINAEVKQNGQAVLDVIERELRGASGVVGLTPGQLGTANSGIEITRSDKPNLYVVCKNEYIDPGNAENNTNGWIGIAEDDSAPSDLAGYNRLTNGDTKSGVNILCAVVRSKAFQVHRDANNNATGVAIYFSAQQAINAPSRVDFIAEAQFQTTIALRNYQ